MRYRYAGPYKSRDRAAEALNELFANGEISTAEAPQIDQLRDHRGKSKGFQITLEDWS